ncbi:hypothetical protein L208DRAFT_1379169 [Tricholoma matsutake]|nr:hypothetical protein L208DRAFT_1379169 [Tricholoma matsutake 945]
MPGQANLLLPPVLGQNMMVEATDEYRVAGWDLWSRRKKVLEDIHKDLLGEPMEVESGVLRRSAQPGGARECWDKLKLQVNDVVVTCLHSILSIPLVATCHPSSPFFLAISFARWLDGSLFLSLVEYGHEGWCLGLHGEKLLRRQCSLLGGRGESSCSNGSSAKSCEEPTT